MLRKAGEGGGSTAWWGCVAWRAGWGSDGRTGDLCVASLEGMIHIAWDPPAVHASDAVGRRVRALLARRS